MAGECGSGVGGGKGGRGVEVDTCGAGEMGESGDEEEDIVHDEQYKFV